ncbi:MAG: hypothetical protein AAGA43_12415 [Bacteroidota bacterium]
MKILKLLTRILLLLLLALTITSFFMSGFIPLFSIGFGLLFVYYFVVYGIIFLAIKTKKTVYTYSAYFLFFLPFVWSLLDFEGLFNFLLQGVHLDMK